MVCNEHVVDWKTKGLEQEAITNTLTKFIDIYNAKLKDNTCASHARLRPELQNIFSGYRRTYDLIQRQTYLHQPDGVTPLTQKDWRWGTVLRRFGSCARPNGTEIVDNRSNPINI